MNESRPKLVPVTLNKTGTGFTIRAEGKTYRLKSSAEDFGKFLDQFQFYTDAKPVTKTENDYGTVVKNLEAGEKQKLFLYQNRANKLYAYLRKHGNPYKKKTESFLECQNTDDLRSYIDEN